MSAWEAKKREKQHDGVNNDARSLSALYHKKKKK